MTLPVSGAISFNNINVELGVAGTTQASLGQTSYRTLAGVASGAISMSNFWGKSNQFAFTISSNQTNANLRTLAVNAGWNQTTKVVATINSGVYISSNSTGTPALTVNGSFPGGVELVNNGYIIGMGGNGGLGAISNYYSGTTSVSDGSGGSSGGLALSVSTGITIQNNGTIGGGGGGGGGGKGGTWSSEPWYYSAGGSGGGGRSSAAANSSGGAARALGSGYYSRAGGDGTVSSAGAGGGGLFDADGVPRFNYNNPGGAGGGWGTAGSSGSAGSVGGGSYTRGPYAGGSGGAAVSGNGYISWSATGTRLGGIS